MAQYNKICVCLVKTNKGPRKPWANTLHTLVGKLLETSFELMSILITFLKNRLVPF